MADARPPEPPPWNHLGFFQRMATIPKHPPTGLRPGRQGGHGSGIDWFMQTASPLRGPSIPVRGTPGKATVRPSSRFFRDPRDGQGCHGTPSARRTPSALARALEYKYLVNFEIVKPAFPLMH